MLSAPVQIEGSIFIMSKRSILEELETECMFLTILKDRETINGYSVFRRKIGHIRADYDGYKWWNSVWPCHNELCTTEISQEINSVYERLIAKDAFSTLIVMRNFCYMHPEAIVNEQLKDEYNFYYTGEHCYFWIRCITRSGEYNLYLHAFTKES